MESEASIVFEVSQFVDYFNQTMEYAYTRIRIRGEVANVKQRNSVVYFDLKDDYAKVEFWGYLNSLPYPIEPGMLAEVVATPRLHPKFGFKLNFYSIKLIGEGSIKKSSDLLKEKLSKEGLFDQSRKRIIPYPPSRIGLITSTDSAAYADFIKILSNRFGGIEILVRDVLVQGEKSNGQIIEAIKKFNSEKDLVDVLVITRGGGSPEDLQYFNSETLVRAIVASRIPTLVAIGHETDESLAELAADSRASTPSNAAESLSPSRQESLVLIKSQMDNIKSLVNYRLDSEIQNLENQKFDISKMIDQIVTNETNQILLLEEICRAYNPKLPLARGYALIKKNGKYLNKKTVLNVNDKISIETISYNLESEIKFLERKNDQK